MWRKSSYSSNGGNCVEFAATDDDLVAVRNSRDPQGTVLLFDYTAISDFIKVAKAGEFDDLAA